MLQDSDTEQEARTIGDALRQDTISVLLQKGTRDGTVRHMHDRQMVF